MVNRVQVGYPAVMRTVRKPKPIEIGKKSSHLFIKSGNSIQSKSLLLFR